MYNIIINQECSEEEYVAIVASISSMLDIPTSLVNIKPFRRTEVNVPAWASIARHERFENKI
ncbi:MAG: hypothetical protein IJS47_06600 [Clostridia bacterium]|nr:hypothetical protein [Clostridia bacterium]